MIVRIVKLIISKEKTKDFCLFFNNIKTQIVEFEGCKKVELLQDTKNLVCILLTVIGKMKHHWIIIETLYFLKIYGIIQNCIFVENRKRGV